MSGLAGLLTWISCLLLKADIINLMIFLANASCFAKALNLYLFASRCPIEDSIALLYAVCPIASFKMLKSPMQLGLQFYYHV
jgi:hypothetical protein